MTPEGLAGMGVSVNEMAYPAIEFSQGHLVIVHDERELRRCTRAGVRRGWHDDLVIVDSSLRRWSVTLVRTRPDGLTGWVTGRLIADLRLDQPEPVDLDDVREQALDVLQRHADFWDADGQLDRRLQALRRAGDLRQLVDALETDDP